VAKGIVASRQSSERILLNDFVSQWREVGADAQAALQRVGESGWLILGREVKGFEAELAAYCQLPHAVGCASGLDAIEIALRVLGLEPGDKVITTPLSAFATTLAIVRAGGVPVFVDVDGSGLLDLERVAHALSRDRAIKFCVPVHLYGHALDGRALERIAAMPGVQLVEDCAQAIGAQSRGKPVGSIGAAAATSFYPTKNLGALGDGGALLPRHRGRLPPGAQQPGAGGTPHPRRLQLGLAPLSGAGGRQPHGAGRTPRPRRHRLRRALPHPHPGSAGAGARALRAAGLAHHGRALRRE
jgi:hypothetical protein